MQRVLHQLPRVLVFVGWYLPGYKAGGPIQSIKGLISNMQGRIDFTVVTKDRDVGDRTQYPTISYIQSCRIEGAAVRYVRPGWLGIPAIWRAAASREYTVTYLNSLFNPRLTIVPLVLRRLSLTPKRRVIVAPRGELSEAALDIKHLKKSIYLTVSRLIGLYDGIVWQATSAREVEQIRRFLPKAEIRMVGEFTDAGSMAQLHRRAHAKESGVLRVVFVSRIARMKNLLFLIERLRSIQGNVSLDIYGPVEDQQYWHECERAMASLPENVSARYCGTIPHQDVSSVLSRYDLFSLPTLAENHGHVILEAACAGCPLLISDQTPWNDVQRRGAGWSLSLDDENGFEDALRHMLQCDNDTWRIISESAVAYGLSHVASPALVEAYLDLFGVQPTRDH